MKGFALAIGIVLCNVLAVCCGKYVIELFVARDQNIAEHYKKAGDFNNSKRDIAYVVTEVNKLFGRLKHRGLDIEIRVRKTATLPKAIAGSLEKWSVNSAVALRDFQKYLKDENVFTNYKYDLAVRFTWRDLIHKGRSIIYHSEEEVICQENAAIVVKFDGTSKPIFTLASAIGDAIGLKVDTKECGQDYIMAPIIVSGRANQFDFSNCSIDQLSRLLPRYRCLQTTSDKSIIPDSRPSSDMLDMDTVCQRRGDDYMSRRSSYYAKIAQGDVVCKGVYCESESFGSGYGVHATEGMICEPGKRCKQGKCDLAPPDFPVRKQVKDGCVFGETPGFKYDKKMTTCQAYFAKDSNRGDCNYDWFKHQCCETCSKIRVPTVPKYDACPTTDSNWCHMIERDTVCPQKYPQCCNYCHVWIEEPIIGKRDSPVLGVEE